MAQVSVITATRNRAHYLRELIDSVIAQTFSDWEMVIVDNASEDETRELVAQCQTRFPQQFQYFQMSSNLGWSPGIAFGAEKAVGDLLLFIGDDDLLMPNILKLEISEFMRNPQLALVYANMWIGKEPYQEQYYSHEYCGPVDRPLSVAEFLYAPRYCGIIAQTALIRRQVYRNIGGLDLRWTFWADGDMHFQIATRFPVLYLPAPLAFFRRHSDNVTVSQFDRGVEEEFAYWKEVHQNTRNETDNRAIVTFLTRRRRQVALDYYGQFVGQARNRRSWKKLGKALKIGGADVRLLLSLFLVSLLSLLPSQARRMVRQINPPQWMRALATFVRGLIESGLQ